MTFTEDQPRTGDTILHCGHLLDAGKTRWFRYAVPAGFVRFDGSRGMATWFAACEACFIKHGDRVADFARGDEVWVGDGPVIEQEELS